MYKEFTIINLNYDYISLTGKCHDLAKAKERILSHAKRYSLPDRLEGYNFGCSIPVGRFGINLTVLLRNDCKCKIKMNPSYMSYSDLNEVRRIVPDLLCVGLDDIWNNWTITRLDTSVDVLGGMDDVILHKKGSQHTQCVVNNRTGKVETMYFGKRAAGVVYNKTSAWNRRKRLSDLLPAAKCNVLRFEKREGRQARRTLASEYASEKNPFEDFLVYNLQEMMNHSKIPIEYLELCQFKGVRAALTGLLRCSNYRLLSEFEEFEYDFLSEHRLSVLIRNARKRLLFFHPGKKWIKLITKLDDKYFYYNHTGLISEQLLDLSLGDMSSLSACQKLILNFSESKGIDVDSILGMPITKLHAKMLLRGY